MQNELLNRKRWTTRVELSHAMFEHIEVFHNRHRRQPQLDYVSPIDHARMLDKEAA